MAFRLKVLTYRKEFLAAGALMVLSISTVFAPNAISQEGQGGPGGPATGNPLDIYAKVGADAGQLAKMKKMADDFELAVRPLEQTLKSSMGEMHRLSLEPTLDEQKILATQDQINKAMCDMSIRRCQLLISLRQVLNDDQRRRLVELLKQRRTGAPGSGP